MANPINNANTPNIETRGGLYPDLNNLRYNITTEQCEAYIQKKFNTVLAMMRAGKCTDKDGKPLPAIDFCKTEMYNSVRESAQYCLE